MKKPTVRSNVILAFALFVAPTAAFGAEPGMFLCATPVLANNFFNDLVTVMHTGASLNREIDASIAAKNGCQFVASGDLKPVDFVAGELLMTDGHARGFSAVQLYIAYVNRPNR